MVENARGVRRERIVFRCGQASLSVGATNGVVREVTLTAIGRSQANGIPLRRTFVVGSGASAAAILECGPHIFELARDADGSVVVEAWINDAIDGGVFFVGTKDGIVAEARRM